VHVFGNAISGNATAAVILAGYKQQIKDAKYEPLPTDIVVKGNIIGRNGWAPQIDGMTGMALPPILWDGATHFVRDGQPVDETVNVVIKDGPVLKLNLKDVTDMNSARLQKLATVEGRPVAEPRPVVLPAAQARLAGK